MFDIRIKEQHGDQIVYVILDDAEHTKIFPSMLSELDENQNKYHIKSYGLSNSSIEQVFLRVANEIKRPEDYERISRWKKIKSHIKQLLGQNGNNEEKKKEIDENENNDDQTQLNTGLSGKMKSQIFFFSKKKRSFFSKINIIE
jgi:hypothetical protein